MIRFLLTLAGLWLIGLVIFIINVPTETSSRGQLVNHVQQVSAHSAIVVFTGGGGARIAKAMELFQTGIGQRLLISGVHPETTRDQLQKLWAGETTRFNCCVDLGLKAQTTRGNAHELVEWAKQHRLSTIVLVTSDYHLPRALAEARALGGELTIVPYAAPSAYIKTGGLSGEPAVWKVLGTEYSKFLMARTTHLLRL